MAVALALEDLVLGADAQENRDTSLLHWLGIDLGGGDVIETSIIAHGI
jgi:hypothetical protein